MIRVDVRNMSAGAVGRHHNHRNVGTVTKVVELLDVTRIRVSTAFVEGNEYGGLSPEFRIGLHEIDDLLNKSFEQIHLRRRWVPIYEPTGLNVGHRRQRTVLNVIVEVGRVLQVRGSNLRITHDRG